MNKTSKSSAHANCTHESTKSARALCRRNAQSANVDKIIKRDAQRAITNEIVPASVKKIEDDERAREYQRLIAQIES